VEGGMKKKGHAGSSFSPLSAQTDMQQHICHSMSVRAQSRENYKMVRQNRENYMNDRFGFGFPYYRQLDTA